MCVCVCVCVLGCGHGLCKSVRVRMLSGGICADENRKVRSRVSLRV